jgi:hypothetical protein
LCVGVGWRGAFYTPISKIKFENRKLIRIFVIYQKETKKV